MAISENDLQKILRNRLFAGVNPQSAERIFAACGCYVADFADGEVMLSPETPEKYAGILLGGKAVVTTPDPTRKALLRFLSSGEPFGIANLFTDSPYISVIRAHGGCRAFLLPESAVRMLLEEDHAFLYQYLGFLSGRIQYLNRKIGYLTAGSAERRLALYLLSLGQRSVRLDASISALSELLDVGRASLYRAFDRLTEDGFLRKEGRHFTLLDPNGMLEAYK